MKRKMVATLTQKPKGFRFNVDMSRHLISIGATYLSIELKRDGTIIVRPDRLGYRINVNENTSSPVCSVFCADFYEKVVLKHLQRRLVFDVAWNNRMKAYILSVPDESEEAMLLSIPGNEIVRVQENYYSDRVIV